MTDDPMDDTDPGAPTDGDETSPFDHISRRRLVATGAATWASIALAGCSDTGPDPTPSETVTVTSTTTTTETVATPEGSDDTPDGNDTPTDSPTASPTPTDSPTATPSPTETPCANSMAFARGSPVGFLIGLFETETGDLLNPEHAESVTVEFDDPTLDTLELTWEGKHREFVADRWGGKLADTSDFPPGTYQYDVVVSTAAGEQVITTDQFVIV